MWIQLVLRFELLHLVRWKKCQDWKAILSSKIYEKGMQLMLGVTGLKHWAVQLTEIWKDCPDLTDMWPLPLDVTMDAARKMHISCLYRFVNVSFDIFNESFISPWRTFDYGLGLELSLKWIQNESKWPQHFRLVENRHVFFSQAK